MTGQSPNKHPFLSDEWIAAARAIRAEYEGRTPAPPMAVRMNQVVNEVPFGEGTINAHLDTSDGQVDLELGHLEAPDLTVTLDYETAKNLLVEANPQAGMQAFMAGRIRVDGDIAKLMAFQQQAVTIDPIAVEIALRVREITE